MEMRAKEKKIRDYVTFKYGFIPTVVDIERHDVLVGVLENDVERLSLDTDVVEKELTEFLTRKVRLEVVANEVR